MKYLALAICFILVCLSSGCVDNGSGEPVNTSTVLDVYDDKLAPKPNNFELVKRNFYDSQINDFTKIDQDIWKRPEFYPTWERSGLPGFEEHDYSRWGVHGYGFFPSVESWTATNMKAGDELIFNVFLHTSWGVETWQGMKLEPVHNKELFDVEITPNEFYLEPTFPEFYPEWAKMIQFKVTAKKDIPKSTYQVSVTVSPPDGDRVEGWSWDILDKFTDEKYHSAIEQCKLNSDCETCDELILQRQNKYVNGNLFTPSNTFVSIITVN